MSLYIYTRIYICTNIVVIVHMLHSLLQICLINTEATAGVHTWSYNSICATCSKSQAKYFMTGCIANELLLQCVQSLLQCNEMEDNPLWFCVYCSLLHCVVAMMFIAVWFAVCSVVCSVQCAVCSLVYRVQCGVQCTVNCFVQRSTMHQLTVP